MGYRFICNIGEQTVVKYVYFRMSYADLSNYFWKCDPPLSDQHGAVIGRIQAPAKYLHLLELQGYVGLYAEVADYPDDDRKRILDPGLE